MIECVCDLEIESGRVCISDRRRIGSRQFHVRYSNRIHRNNMWMCLYLGLQSTNDENNHKRCVESDENANDEGECFNMLLSLCFPPCVEHVGVWRL